MYHAWSKGCYRRTDGSVTISLRNFVGKGIIILKWIILFKSLKLVIYLFANHHHEKIKIMEIWQQSYITCINKCWENLCLVHFSFSWKNWNKWQILRKLVLDPFAQKNICYNKKFEINVNWFSTYLNGLLRKSFPQTKSSSMLRAEWQASTTIWVKFSKDSWIKYLMESYNIYV